MQPNNKKSGIDSIIVLRGNWNCKHNFKLPEATVHMDVNLFKIDNLHKFLNSPFEFIKCFFLGSHTNAKDYKNIGRSNYLSGLR